MSDKNNNIVHLNVGGTKYQVSKGLMEQYPTTMLARMVSETWMTNPQQEIFIDRDGETFRYVLNYMRNLKVNLPNSQTLSSEALMEELKYFGFENIPEGAIRFGCSPNEAMGRVVKHRQAMKKLHDKRIKKFRDKFRQQEGHETVAYACFETHCRDGAMQVKISSQYISDIKIELLNEVLVTYGLRCTQLKKDTATYAHVELEITES